jgi:hypothetical protein
MSAPDQVGVSYWTVPGRIVLCDSCTPGLIKQERRHPPVFPTRHTNRIHPFSLQSFAAHQASDAQCPFSRSTASRVEVAIETSVPSSERLEDEGAV